MTASNNARRPEAVSARPPVETENPGFSATCRAATIKAHPPKQLLANGLRTDKSALLSGYLFEDSACESTSDRCYPAENAYPASVLQGTTNEELLKKFAASEVDAFAGNRARLVEAVARYPGLRVAQDKLR